MDSSIISFLPFLTMQVIYSIFVAQIAKRTNKNVVLYVVLSLIPFLGAFFFIYVMWTTLLRVLDQLNELKEQKNVAS